MQVWQMRAELMRSPSYNIQTSYFRSSVRLRWRIRFRVWRWRRKLRRLGLLEIDQEMREALEHQIMFGSKDPSDEG